MKKIIFAILLIMVLLGCRQEPPKPCEIKYRLNLNTKDLEICTPTRGQESWTTTKDYEVKFLGDKQGNIGTWQLCRVGTDSCFNARVLEI